MKLKIRKSQPDDVPVLADLWHELAAFHAKGVKTVEVRVSTANPVATYFWWKMGFEPYMTMNKREI
jgi:hypothetical protein